jgi:hypothetical protein
LNYTVGGQAQDRFIAACQSADRPVGADHQPPGSKPVEHNVKARSEVRRRSALPASKSVECRLQARCYFPPREPGGSSRGGRVLS